MKISVVLDPEDGSGRTLHYRQSVPNHVMAVASMKDLVVTRAIDTLAEGMVQAWRAYNANQQPR